MFDHLKPPRTAERSSRRTWWARAITVCTALIVTIGLAELLLRLAGMGREVSPPMPLWLEDARVGILHPPSLSVTIRDSEFVSRFTTNGGGFRATSEFLDGTRERPVIAVLGDSFVEALQVHDSETFAERLAEMLRGAGIAQVQNFGVARMGLVHYYLMYREHARRHRPQVVLVAILESNDITNSSSVMQKAPMARPRYRYDNEGRILDVAPFEMSALWPEAAYLRFWYGAKLSFLSVRVVRIAHSAYLRLRSVAATGGFPSDALIYEDPWDPIVGDAWRHAGWALEELVRMIRGDAAEPVVVLLPSKWTASDRHWGHLERKYTRGARLDREKPRRTIHRFCEDQNVKFVDLTDDLRGAVHEGRPVYFDEDAHLTSLGHAIVARTLCKALYPGLRDCEASSPGSESE